MTLTVEKVYDPIPPSEESKGRKSYKVIMTDGESYYAGDDVGPHMTVGHSYDNLDVGLDKYGNKWLNWAKGKPGNGGTPTQPRPAVQKIDTAGKPNTTRDKSIILQTIIKSCARPDGSEEQADAWLVWYAKRMRTGAPPPEAVGGGGETAPSHEEPDDSTIPF